MAFCERKPAQGTMWHVKIIHLLCFPIFFLNLFSTLSWIMHIECCFLCWLLSLFCFFFFLFVSRKWWFKIVKDMLSTSNPGDLMPYRSFLLVGKLKVAGLTGVFLKLSTETRLQLWKSVKSLVHSLTQPWRFEFLWCCSISDPFTFYWHWIFRLLKKRKCVSSVASDGRSCFQLSAYKPTGEAQCLALQTHDGNQEDTGYTRVEGQTCVAI